MVTTGDRIKIIFTYEDGSQSSHGSWRVPHDSDYSSLEEVSSSLGWEILYEIAKQPSKTVAGIEIQKISVYDKTVK